MYDAFKIILGRCALILAATVLLNPLVSQLPVMSAQNVSFAQAQGPTEAEAFEATKALGTVDAWNAYVANYPTGFRADLARAYLKQLTNPAAAPPSPPVTQQQVAAPEQPAFEQPCSQQRNLRSRQSDVPAKLRFVNNSEGTVVLQWIDFNGSLKEFGTLEPGASVTQDTFLTHAWITAYGEGSCRQIFLPAEGVSVARIKPESELQKKAPPAVKPQVKKPVAPPLQCAPNYRKVGNQCVLIQNCGPNATRNPEGDCFCNRGFRMMNGQCSRPQQQPNQCGRNETYSSSMGQCIPRF